MESWVHQWARLCQSLTQTLRSAETVVSGCSDPPEDPTVQASTLLTIYTPKGLEL